MSAPDHHPASSNGDDLLWRHLKTVPAFRALLRAVEARFYRHLAIPEPVLDLGCGDGHFASMAFDHPLTVGVDPWWGPLQKARSAAAYHLNVQALGDALPFADGAFASAISNSVLEHIPDVQSVLNEAARVLQPGGMLVMTTPSHLFTEYLGGASLLQPLGLAGAYRRFFNRLSRHAHTDPPQIWAQRLARAGFAVERWQYYFSRQALRALELGHVQGLPSAALHLLTGHWIIAPWRDNLRPTERWLRPYYEEEPADPGAYIFMIARKQSTVPGTSEPLEVRLPAPRPLPIDEPTLTETNEPRETPGRMTVEPAITIDEVITFVPKELDFVAEPADRTESNWRGLGALVLLLVGILAAYTGQSSLSQRPPSPAGGMTWYAISFVAFGAAALLQRWMPEQHRIAFSRRLLLYPVALILALFAQEQSDASLIGGNPLLAFTLWFAAIATAFYALSIRSNVDRTATEATERRPSLRADQESAVRHSLPLIIFALFLVALIPRLMLLASHPFMLNGIEASIGLDAISALQGHIRNPFATAWLTNPTLPLYPASIPLALIGRSVLSLRLLPALVGALTVPALFLFSRRIWGFWTALAAALLLAGYHLHVHYSRLGTTNVWDPLLALLFFGALALALSQPSRRNWLFTGLAGGLSAYVYTAGHLMPFFLLGLLLYLLLFHHDLVFREWPNLLAAAAMGLAVALPQIVFYQANPGLYMERANTLGVLHSNWLVQQVAAGQSTVAVLGDQFRRAFLAFNGSLDTSTTYNPGIPLLRFWPSIFFALGVALAIWRIRQIRYGLLLVWLFVTLIFGGALLVDAPASHRLLIAAPAVVLLTVSGIHWLAKVIATVLRGLLDDLKTPAPWSNFSRPAFAVLIIVAIFVAGDLFFYFGAYRNSYRFGDRNTEIAYQMGQYLDSLDGNRQAYFHGPPSMYVTFPTIIFLAEEFTPGQNLLDVEENSQPATEPEIGTNLVFIFLPERSAEVNQVAERFPDGNFLTFDGVLSNPLFYSYEVSR